MSDERLLARLRELKQQRNAVILAHNYQRAEVQDAADFTGDSLGLSQEAAKTAADVILFCGVHFMAETAAIICPDKTVLIPDPNAGCPMANMVSPRELAVMKAKHPNAAVVTYVNSSAAIKAMSDVCCTSANAVKVVATIPPDREVLFVPDQSLGDYVAKQLGRPLILWPGYCPTHHHILARDVQALKAEHPDALFICHPECTSDVVALADHVASTSGMVRWCRETAAKTIIVGTEIGLLHRLRKDSPDKTFLEVSPLADCPNMKLNTLEKMAWSLEDMVYRVTVPPEVAGPARRAIERMLEIT
ncbi:MAG TPA: quinolinate synthase NadA [Planctomycetota bacterium]|nr:quinolinate synthase NadA [Planctomycetota bacterium]